MADLFLKIVNMSISASWLVLAVVLLRIVLKKAPKRFRPVLWGIVGVRLLLPFSIESVFSLIPSAETISPEIMYTQEPAIQSGIPPLNAVVNPIITGSFSPSPVASANPLQVLIPLAAMIWIAGMAAMLIYLTVSYLRLRRQVRTAVLFQDHIYQSERVASPFVLGFFRPRIYLPFRLPDKDLPHVIAHEQAHIRRHDHWIKPIGFLLLAVYWFNPVLWAAYILLCRDIELACDERVIRDLGTDQRADYSEALLSCSVPRRRIAACPLAFGEVGVKARVKHVLNYKKPAFWIIVAAVLACIVVAVCFLTNPKKEPADVSSGKNPSTASSDEDIKWDTPPMIIMDGAAYFSPYAPVSELPYGYEYAGTISNEQATDTGTAGCEYYTNPADENSFYVFQECGTRTSINFVDNRKIQWAYVRWIKEGSNALDKQTLTLDDVRFLSKRGRGLTWEDFDKYLYRETGSGLYIREYQIDEMFFLLIGGGSTEASPMYISLYANDGWDEQIDIRDGGVEEFIAEHKNNPLVKECTYTWQYSSVGYSPDAEQKMMELGGIPKFAATNSVQAFPVVRINSVNELKEFMEDMSQYNLDFDYSGPGTLSFTEAVKDYDDEFFASTALFLLYVTEGTTINRYSIEYVRRSGETLSIGIMVSEPPQGGEAESGFIIAIAVPADQISGVTELDARISSIYYPYSEEPVGNVKQSYAFAEGYGTSITLYDSGEFTFTFSFVSSYWGYGRYEIKDDRLTLYTDDGNYTYVFDMVGDTLVFDADHSSEQTWFSGLYDGAVLQ